MFVSGDGFMHAFLRFCKGLCGFLEVEAELRPFLTLVFKFQGSFFFGCTESLLLYIGFL